MHQMIASALLALAVLVTAGTAAAQDYSNRPLKVIVPFGPGAGTDATAATPPP